MPIFLLLFSSFAQAEVEMKLEKTDGTFDLLSQYRGKWVVVNYWATWCPPCIEEMPDLQAFHDDNYETAVVIGINSENVSKAKLEQFLDDYFITYPVYTSAPSSFSELGSIPGLPTTFVVSPSGTVEAKQVGSVTKESIEHFIRHWKK